jgi:hypothetical protein
MGDSDDSLDLVNKENGHTIRRLYADGNSWLIRYDGIKLTRFRNDEVSKRTINSENLLPVNLIDRKKPPHINIESFSENFPVTVDILLAVSLFRAEIEADKIALTNAAMPGAKSMC